MERLQLLEAATDVTLDVRTVLFEPGGPIDALYFPTGGGLIGHSALQRGRRRSGHHRNEGIVEVPLVLPVGGFAVRAITQVAGHGIRLEAGVFVEWLKHSSALQTLVDRYSRCRRSSGRSPRQRRATGFTQVRNASAAGSS